MKLPGNRLKAKGSTFSHTA